MSITNWLNHNRYKCREQEHSALKITLNDIFLFFFGLGCTQMLVDTAKFTIGRHRPNFIASCEPRVEAFDPKTQVKTLVECQTQSHLRYSYIVDYECTKSKANDVNLSFFSGHAATISFAAVYVSILLAQRLRRNLETTIGKLIVALLIVLELDMAIYVSLTRVSDYKHHPTDVALGFVVGSLMAIFIKLFLDKNRCNVEEEESDKPKNIQLSECI